MALRIIGGELKGRKLRSVSGRHTRPTADRVRESIFNILASRVRGAVALDMFAGTGALGIEALSRGAESALFVDNQKAALTILAGNIKACALENRAKIIQWNILRNLNCLRALPSTFNLVLMDPPYNKEMILPALSHLHNSGALQTGACVTIEHAQQEPIVANDLPFEISDQRRYGKTLVSFLDYVL